MRNEAIEFGSGNAEVGMRPSTSSDEAKWEKWKEAIEFRSGTRRRPIVWDYGAARCGLRTLRAVGSFYELEEAPVGIRESEIGLQIRQRF
jgi:hypothetical protein